MNFPEPSGSSPFENPPGKIKASDLLRVSANFSTENFIASGVIVLTTKISDFPPEFSTARAVSYSQFVPAKTGIKNFGLDFAL